MWKASIKQNSETGKLLMGANMIIEGTMLGDATDWVLLSHEL